MLSLRLCLANLDGANRELLIELTTNFDFDEERSFSVTCGRWWVVCEYLVAKRVYLPGALTVVSITERRRTERKDATLQ